MFDDILKHAPDEEPKRQEYFIGEASRLLSGKKGTGKNHPSCYIATFGCQMNFRDSEKLLGILTSIGYKEALREEDADLILMNTCTVRDNANQRIFGRLGVLKGYKKANPDLKIAMCGCMMQEPTVIEKIQKSYPYVDLIFGTHNIYRLAEYLTQVLSDGKRIIAIEDHAAKVVEDLPVIRKYPYKSGVNIMYGCDNFCSYCIVPYVRGREHSREPDEIIGEIGRLAKDGVREVMLLGQNVNSYGKNCTDPISFAKLLKRVEEVEGIDRIRFMTSHPKDLSDELIGVMRDSKKICRHLHLPLQSGSSRILKLMNRHYDKEHYIDLALKIREMIPDIAISTDIIIGFPTETKEDVDETLDVIRKVRFDNAFTFLYSKRTGTPAASMDGQVDEAFAKEQFDRVLKLVQETAKEQTEKWTGKEVPVLIEEINEQDPHLVTGRMSNNLLVHFPGEESDIGQIVTVHLAECRGFYFIGKRVTKGGTT